MKVILIPKEKFRIPVEAENISTDYFAGKQKSEIEALPVWEGNRERKIGDLFDVRVEEKSGMMVVIDGDVEMVKRIGEGMSYGEIVIKGSVGMHCGALMKGGKITINGDADDWCGRELRGGEIVVEGTAGNYVGSGYRGESPGISGGRIVVKGDAGDYAGESMSGGEILILGSAGLLPGYGMTGGTIRIKGMAYLPGGEMKGGKIFVEKAEILPSFKYEGIEVVEGKEKRRYLGDLACRGKGYLYIGELL
jgi:formylmethanofuran dehydrogenase subunit C